MDCIESIVWNNGKEFQSNPSDNCWKMTRLCRDVISTPNMDEFGNGPSKNPLPPSAYPTTGTTPNTAAFVAALACGCVSGLAMIHVLRGGFSRFFSASSDASSNGDVQFSAVPDREIA